MTFTSTDLKKTVTSARPLIEQSIGIALQIAAIRDEVTEKGGDWSQLKALIKAQLQDEGDGGERVKKILDKATSATAYADMLGWGNLNEDNFSADDEADEIPPALPAADRATEATPPASVATPSEPSGLARSDPQRSVGSTREGERLDGSDPNSNLQEIVAGSPSVTTTEPAAGATPASGRPNSSPTPGADTGETVSTPVSPVAIRKPFRPHCLDRQACAGMGNHHCSRCERAYLAKLDPVG